ncbi:MAG: hypothetical protein ABJ056_09230 [Halioglobus sp.]
MASHNLLARLSSITLVLLLLAAKAWQGIQDDLSFSELDTEVSFWGDDSYHPSQLTRQRIALSLEQQLQRNPRNSKLLAVRANQLAWEGFWADSDEDYREYSRQALAAQYASLLTRPAYGQGWTKLLQYQAVDEPGEELHNAVEPQLQKLKRWQ